MERLEDTSRKQQDEDEQLRSVVTSLNEVSRLNGEAVKRLEEAR